MILSLFLLFSSFLFVMVAGGICGYLQQWGMNRIITISNTVFLLQVSCQVLLLTDTNLSFQVSFMKL